MDELLTNLFAATTIASLFATHAVVGWRRDPSTLLALAGLDAFLLLLGMGYLDEDIWNEWMREDAWVEWATFYAFTAAGVLSLKNARAPQGLARLSAVGVGLFCLFVAGEEISWGQRLLAFEPPEIFLEQNFQQEFNLHNLLQNKEIGGFELESRYLVALIAMVYGVIGAALPLLPVIGERLKPLCPSPALAPVFAGVAWFEWVYPVHLGGEAAECVFGLVFLADAGLRLETPKTMTGLTLGALVLGAMTAPMLEVILYGTDEARVQEARIELDQMDVDLEDAITRRLAKKSRVHKRIFTATQAGYLDFGEDSTFLEGRATPADEDATDPRRDRRGYFLDPWNNAYWILSDDKGEMVVLYSFGPNRRRDTDTKPFEGIEGDDVGVIVR